MMPDAAHECTGVILVGGRATRYGGRPKGLALVGGRRIVDRVAAALRQVTDALVVAGSPAPLDAGDATPLVADALWLPDHRPGAGPLAALADAIAAAGTPVLVVAWDMPLVSPSLLGELRRVGERVGAAAVVPESDADGHLEPLCAYYTPRAGEAAARLAAAGEHRMHALVEAVRAERLALARVLAFGPPHRIFLNVNTPADRDEAERLLLGASDPTA